MDAARMSTSPIVQHMVAVKEGDHVENQEPEIVVADHVQPVPLALEVGAPSANEGRQGPLAAAIKCDSYEVFQSSLLTTTYCTASLPSKTFECGCISAKTRKHFFFARLCPLWR